MEILITFYSKKIQNILVIKQIFFACFLKNNFYKKKYFKLFGILTFGIFPFIIFQKQILTDTVSNQIENENDIKIYQSSSNPKWETIHLEKEYEQGIFWEKIKDNSNRFFTNKEVINKKNSNQKNSNYGISSLNRSIVFDNSIVGPDISWLVPPGFKWNNKYKFDASTRGHSRRKKGEKFLGWNDGDAVGQFYYQFLNSNKRSFGLNFGIRSVYIGKGAAVGFTPFGEGQSMGFRIDHKISQTSGFAFGAEQLLHLDGLTDTGRDIYLTYSKAIWSGNKKGEFPLSIFTVAAATGKMAEGNLKFFCSDLLGGSGTEILHQRSLCWSPVFTISRIYNQKISTFFEYNSKFFLLGTSVIPFNEIPLRGTFAVQLSDHIDNYKLNSFEELKWVFRLSLGF